MNCSEVLGSEWAYVFRTPIAVLGLAYNLLLAHVSEEARGEVARKPRLDAQCRERLNTLGLVLLAGLAFVVYVTNRRVASPFFLFCFFVFYLFVY